MIILSLSLSTYNDNVICNRFLYSNFSDSKINETYRYYPDVKKAFNYQNVEYIKDSDYHKVSISDSDLINGKYSNQHIHSEEG